VLSEGGGAERVRFTFPRQHRDRRLCLADFFRSEDSGETDVIAFMVVTMGKRISEVTGELFAANSYREYLELHGLTVQLAEALTEYWHKRIRSELTFAGGVTAAADDSDNLDEIFRQGYRGSRYSFGYPACPDLEQQVPVFELLHPERVDVTLSEEFQLVPEQSTSSLVVHHPEAKYFATR
jgi:5-methyltetrahydrofolate--homocysteine methyltransferase